MSIQAGQSTAGVGEHGQGDIQAVDLVVRMSGFFKMRWDDTRAGGNIQNDVLRVVLASMQG